MSDLVTTPRELGVAIRTHRRRLGLTQAQLAHRARVTRQWLVRLERCHPTAELGLVLNVVRALGLATVFRPVSEQAAGEIDLDRVLGDLS